MVFSSTIFLFVFLPAFLLGAIFASRFGARARNLNIVIFSLAFYVFGGGIYTAILIGSILFNWAWARFVLSSTGSRWALAVGIVVNLLPLLVFKYIDFLFEVTTRYLFRPFFSLDLPGFELFLPAGISFYTFQAMSYLIDVYRRETPAERSLLVFSAYKLLFPQLVAGPIVRYVEVRDNLHVARMSLDGLNAGIFLFGAGLAKKMLIADPVGRVVDQIYALPAEQVSNLMAWIANVGYFLQIFFDFSGYSSMAIGLGLMIGLSFPDNFQQPYRAHSITDFWRRWHMTLSRWFRDYLYVPLGGNRRGSVRTALNLCIVFLLCGLWHGAALTFVAWGAYHGLLLIIERIARDVFKVEPRGVAGVAMTLLLVLVGWVLFRSQDFAQAHYMLAKLAFVDRSGVSLFSDSYYLRPYTIALFAAGLLLAWLPVDTWNLRARLVGRRAAQAGLCGVLLVAASVAELAASGFNPFIYFQF